MATLAAAGAWTLTNAFAMGIGNAKKEMRSRGMPRSELPPNVLELQEEEEVPEVEKEPLPERRIPYKLNIVSNLQNHKTIHDDGTAAQQIREKLAFAFDRFEELIRTVDITVTMSEGFHKREATPHAGKAATAGKASTDPSPEEAGDGQGRAPSAVDHRPLAPYVFKARVLWKNGKEFLLSNPEKHAQPSFLQGLDHLCEVLGTAMKKAKERMIKEHRREHDFDTTSRMDEAAEEAAEDQQFEDDLLARQDAEADRMYQAIETGKASS